MLDSVVDVLLAVNAFASVVLSVPDHVGKNVAEVHDRQSAI
jgi:hypothetical protein